MTETANDATGPAKVTPTRSPRISPEDVFAAADALLLAGHKPTIDRVRMRLGRGSPNTIQEHLDTWWTRLGSRLRDIPGQELPGLPDRIVHTLRKLWSDAVESARDSLNEALSVRETALHERQAELDNERRAIDERANTLTARDSALQESVTLAREQLSAANQRVERLEAAAENRETEITRLRTRAETVDAEARSLRGKLDTLAARHEAEREQLDERHRVAEARWLGEVDRARQATQELAKDHERQIKELRGQLRAGLADSERFKTELQELRAENRELDTVRRQLERQLASATRPAARKAASAGRSRKRPRNTAPHR